MLRSKKTVALSVLTGLLLILSFPRFDLFPLAFIALIPLFFGICDQSPKQAFLWGWIAGLLYFSGTLSWTTISMHHYGGVPWTISYLLMFLLTAYLALYIGIFACVTRSLKGAAILWGAPACWTALEYLRGHLLTGFPWNALGYSQYRNLAAIQMADITSVYGVSFVIVLINAALFCMIRTGRRERRIAWAPLGTALFVGATVLLYGFYRLLQPMGNGKTLSVAVIQGNVDQAVKWDAQMREATFKKYERLSLSFAESPQLVIWPESAMPFFFQNEPLYQQKILDLTRNRFPLLFGSPAFQYTDLDSLTLFNSAYLVSPPPTGGANKPATLWPVTSQTSLLPQRPWRRYDKIHLVPFGEYVPLQSLLFFVNKMVTGIGEFAPGKEATVWEVAGASVGTVICYEVIFPELVRRFVQNGANLMTTITNDAWFGQSSAPFQHFSMVVFRAIENRVPFARSANTGISGFIDAHGKILQETSIFVDDARLQKIALGGRKTFYTQYGDVFALGCLIVFLGLSYRVFRPSAAKGI